MSPISQREYLSEGNLPMVVSRHEESVKQGFWPKLSRVLASLPFAEEVVAAYYCAFDPATPRKAKGILLAALAYFILPFDVIPDFILGLGFTDDMAVLLTSLNVIRTHMNQGHRDKARAALDRIRRGETMA
ncbi:MAG TPA: YkvA family protein [Aestuariivirga sp.]|nr:YkvA family protein [Aestuariivirga sp.]